VASTRSDLVTTPASAPPRVAGRAFFPTLDGYRAIAATSVVVLHAAVISGFVFREPRFGQYLSRLDIGVSIFFLISGFLMYRPFVLAHFEDRPGPGMRDYFVGRFLRIYPAYWVALIAVVWVFQQPGPQHQINNVGDFIAYFGLLQQYTSAHAYGGIQQAWTLCVEVAFYVFLPLWALGVRAVARRVGSRQTRAVRVELIGLVLLFATGIAYRMIVLTIEPKNAVEISWLPAFFDQFALGMLLAVVSAGREAGRIRATVADAVGRHPWVCWIVAAVGFWLVATQLGLPIGYPTFSRVQWLTWTLGYGFVAFALLLPAVFGNQRESILRRALCHPVIVFLGLVSFGIYLWHELWLDRFFQSTGLAPFNPGANVIAVFIFAMTLSVVAGYFSWKLVERPVMRLRPGRTADHVSLDRRAADEGLVDGEAT
jgi:peptidoglycan/LPS O-acetylase OafA/YrhL